MTSPAPRSPFELCAADDFDARKGFRRCDPPGIGVMLDQGSAVADLWRDRRGRLLVRFSSAGYVYSMKCSLASGRRVPDARLAACTDWLADVLVEWLVDGIDEQPEPSGRYARTDQLPNN